MTERDVEKKIKELEKRVDNFESNYNNRLILLEKIIKDLQDGVANINNNLSDIKTMMTKLSVVNEYNKDIYVTRQEFHEEVEKLRNNIISIDTKLRTKEKENENIWEKYGYMITTLMLIVSLIALILRSGG